MQSPVLATVELSVRPSVCLLHARTVSKRRKLESRNLHRRIAQVLYSFGDKMRSEIRKGSLRARALNENGIGKIHNFQPISRRISETVQEMTKITILMTNTKSHTPFRLVPKSTTLDDLERPILTLLQKRCVFQSPPPKFE